MDKPANHVPRPQKIQPPAIPPSQLPQYVAPTRASKALQFGSFALAGCITAYAVLAYDFGPGEHCFMPVSRTFSITRSAWYGCESAVYAACTNDRSSWKP